LSIKIEKDVEEKRGAEYCKIRRKVNREEREER